MFYDAGVRCTKEVQLALSALAKLAKSASLFRGIVQSNHLLQVLVVLLRESKSSLLLHSLHLSHLSDGLFKLLHSWSVILNIVLLNLLDVMVTLRAVASLEEFPSKITKQTETRNAKHSCPKTQTWVGVAQNTKVFSGNIDSGCNSSVGREPEQPENEGTWNCKKRKLRPKRDDECCFAQCHKGTSSVNQGTPSPLVWHASTRKIAGKLVEAHQANECHSRVVETINNPTPENGDVEELSLLTKLVQLWVSIK